jgi:hypothetical protein
VGPRPAPASRGFHCVKKTFLVLAAIVLSALPLWAADEAAVRVFVLKHKRVEEAMLLIRPHLSESASITLTQKLNAMTVTDRPEKLEQVGKVLAAFDVPPRGFTFAIKLVRARADVPAGSISREIGGLGAKLKSVFQFNDYALIDSAVLRGIEGGRVQYQFAGGDYILDFSIRNTGAGGDLLLSPFTLSRLWNPPGQAAFVRPLYRASMPVTLSQTLVIGASKEEKSKSALILILLAQETPRGDAPEKGAPGPKAAEKRP